MLRAVPIQPWVKGALDVTITFLALDSVDGYLEVDFSPHLKMKGSFKSSNPGSIILNGGKLPQSLLHKVCVKQVYFIQPGTTRVRWYDENDEGSLISAEVLCLDWATVLLDLTYNLIRAFKSSHGSFQGVIPSLCFINTAIAECQKGPGKKNYFLIEEWIDAFKVPFTKYINNRLPVSCALSSRMIFSPFLFYLFYSFLTIHIQLLHSHFLSRRIQVID